MRTIKFRVWDKINKNWMHPVWDITNPFPTNQHHVIEQFTGLQDKNGRDIYEGDIIRLEECYGRVEVSVKFHRGSFDIKGYNWIPKYCEVVGNIHLNTLEQ